MKLPYIEASPRKENFCSSRVANAFIIVDMATGMPPPDKLEELLAIRYAEAEQAAQAF